MEFHTITEGTYLVMQPQGDLKTAEAREFEEVLLRQIEAHHFLIIDLEAVTYICSSGLRALLAAQQAVDGLEEGDLVLKNVCDEVMDVLESTGFNNVLTIR